MTEKVHANMTSATEEGILIYAWEASAVKTRQRRDEAIPEAWRLNQKLLDTLKTPIKKSKNNLIKLNLVR